MIFRAKIHSTFESDRERERERRRTMKVWLGLAEHEPGSMVEAH